MLIRKAYKFRLKVPKGKQNILAQTAGCCRFVWNTLLGIQKERLELGENCLPYTKTAKLLPILKKQKETAWLGDVPSQPLQQALRDLDRAIKDGFSKKSAKQFPRFKKKGAHASFRFPTAPKIVGNSIQLPKLGWFKFYKSRDIVGKSKNATVSRNGSHWYVSIQVEQEIGEPVHPATDKVGIDLGIARFATLSDGTVLNPINPLRKLEKKLIKLQRRLKNKEKGSNNWIKIKRKIQKLYTKIANTRKDYLHKASTKIASTNQIVVMEELKTANMSKSAKGTIEKPGRNVKAKSGLNKSILDQGWYEFRRQIAYKLEWLGGVLQLVNPCNTSRTCPACGCKDKENRKTQATFKCVQCGFEENADLNAARNILALA